jgi:hypothetical protein
MDPPNMDALNLSDSDSDALFDTPAARKVKTKGPDAAADAGEAAPGAKTRAKESHYTTEEAREAALRRELESIKNVNKVIEGVVDSLQKAKDNMEVGLALSWNVPSLTMDRRFPRQSKMHRHSFRHGQGSCLRPSTTSV